MTLSLKWVSSVHVASMAKRKHRHELAARKIVESLQFVSFMHKFTEIITKEFFNNLVP